MKFTTRNIIELRLAMATRGHHDVRFYLNGIHFDFVKGLLTGTNGHIISQSPWDGTDCADMPGEIILDIDGTVAKRADYAVFEIDGDAGTVSLFQDGEVALKVLPVKVIDGTYPDIARVLDPAGLGAVEVKDICFHVPYQGLASHRGGVCEADIQRRWQHGGRPSLFAEDHHQAHACTVLRRITMNSLSTIHKLHAVREVNSEDQPVYLATSAVSTERDDKIINQALGILKRRLREPGDTITSPQTSEAFLQLQLAEREQEVFGALFLDTRHRVIAFRELFYGTIDGASVHPREVVKVALQLNAAACILAHNHPSGVAEPSHADIQITKRLKDSLALIDVRVLDHLIVTADDSVSLAQRGEL